MLANQLLVESSLVIQGYVVIRIQQAQRLAQQRRADASKLLR